MKLEEFSTAVLSKARRMVEADQVRTDASATGVWWVKTYRVAVVPLTSENDVWWTCTCKHGLNNPGQARCSHVAAVLAMTEEERNGTDTDRDVE